MEPMVFGVIFILMVEATLTYFYRVATNRPIPKLLGYRISFMVVWVALVWSGSHAGPIPDHPAHYNFASETSGRCVCTPQLQRRFIMQNVIQSETTQAINHNGNGLELKILTIDSLTIPNHHPRRDLGDLGELQASLRRDGIQDPLLVYEVEAGRFGIIDGARRMKSAREMGWTELSCLIKRGINEAEAAHLSYVRNVERKTLSVIEKARHIRVMRDTFGYTLEELGVMGYGSSATISNKLKLLDLPEKVQVRIQQGELTEGHGLALSELNSPKEQELMAKRIVDFGYSVKITKDKVRRLLSKQAKAKTSAGKPNIIIPSGDISGVYSKDARSMTELPDECIHLVVTSPPYFVGMEYEKGTTWDAHIENIRAVMNECGRTLVPGGVIAVNVADIRNFKGPKGKSDRSYVQLMAHRYQSFLRNHNILLTDTIIWTKRPAWATVHNDLREETPHCSYASMGNWEPIYIFRKKGERQIPSEDIVLQSKLTREQWMAYVNALWDIEPNRQTLQGHPATFPDELVNRLVRMFSYVGDTVLDPFLGSGTTIKVARELNRQGIGYEREIQYKPVIMQKLGIEAREPEAESMAGYAKQSMSEEQLEASIAKEEAALWSSEPSDAEADAQNASPAV